MGNKLESRIEEVMRSVFGIDEDQEFPPNSSPETINTWDSLRHIQLVVALEEEFDVEFNDEEILEMLNYKLIVSLLSGKISIK